MGPSECLQFLRFIFDIHMSGSLKRLFECRLKVCKFSFSGRSKASNC